MSMFDFLNSTLQVPQNISLLNDKVNKKNLYGCHIDHKYISFREYMVYYILLSQQIPTYVWNISTYITKYVRTGNLHKSNVLYMDKDNCTNDMDNSLGSILEFSFWIV